MFVKTAVQKSTIFEGCNTCLTNVFYLDIWKSVGYYGKLDKLINKQRNNNYNLESISWDLD